MNLRGNFSNSKCYLAAAILAAVGVTPVFAQQGRGIVSDWSSHHVKFSNPGTEMDALMHGKRQQYQALVNNPRYQAQQFKRSAAWGNRFAAAESAFSNSGNKFGHSPFGTSSNSIQKDWAVKIAPSGSGTGSGVYPAEFGSFTTASCSDFVVFPVDASGSRSSQANIVAFKNLYKTTCNTGTPTVAFAYYVGSGAVQTSPVLSEDGTKVAFVESKSNGSILHVLTIGTTGSNGTSYLSPAVPGTSNNASDVALTMHGGVSVTSSSPFVDYTDDIAYVGDDNGNVHQFTGVFRGTPTETVGSGWPFNTASSSLTGPIYDSISKHVFVGSSGGYVHCVDLTGSAPVSCSTPEVVVANGTFSSGAVLDSPIVDSTNGRIYSQAVATDTCTGLRCTHPTSSIVLQADTNLANVVRTTVGDGGNDLHAGDFDNTYYNSTTGSGNMYFCGNTPNAATAALYQIPINNGTMSASGSEGPQLVRSGFSYGCSAITEVYNGTTDYLFIGVLGQGIVGGSSNSGCQQAACIMNLNLSTYTSASTPSNGFSLGGNGKGASGIIVDNISSQTGASQIYFGNLQNGDATQVSQSGLQ